MGEGFSSVRLLASHGLSPKKSFGQNFLQDAAACAAIAELATTPPGGTVLEIGAGLGALTAPLCARAARVVAIERDRDLVPILRERLGAQPNLTLLEQDAVRADWLGHLAGGPRPHVIAGNLPYQITGPILRRLCEHAAAIDCAVLMVQREVAERLLAAPGGDGYGALSVFVQAAFALRRAREVGKGAFAPVPRVDSTVVVLTPERPPRAVETPTFRAVVNCAFQARRKQLRNAWRPLAPPDRLAAAAAAAGIALDARGETLAVERFAKMAAALDG
jgi:16S rRNA (adenine1518-N6/adenine1519-N6)-dimethyltransferase